MASREKLINQRKLLQRKVSSGTATSADREKLKALQIQIGKQSASAGVDHGPYAPYTEKQRAVLNKQLPKSTKTVSSVLEREAASRNEAKKRRAALQSLVTESSPIDEDFAGRPSKKPVTKKRVGSGSGLKRETASRNEAKKRSAALQSLVTESSPIDEDFAGRPSKKPVTKKRVGSGSGLKRETASRNEAKKRSAALQSLVTESSPIDEDFAGRPSKKPVTKKRVGSGSGLKRETASRNEAKKRSAALQSLVTESSPIDEDFAGRPSKKPVTRQMRVQKRVGSESAPKPAPKLAPKPVPKPVPAKAAPAKAAPVRPSSDVPFYKRKSVLPLKSRTAAELELIPKKDAERGARQAKRQAEGKPLKSWEGGVRYIDNPFGKGKIKMDTSEKGMFGDSELDDMGQKKGGRLKKASGKKAVKKNTVRKRAALRGHRAELRGG